MLDVELRGDDEVAVQPHPPDECRPRHAHHHADEPALDGVVVHQHHGHAEAAQPLDGSEDEHHASAAPPAHLLLAVLHNGDHANVVGDANDGDRDAQPRKCLLLANEGHLLACSTYK